MFERIIVPLDGSRFAEAALTPARELAQAFGSRMLIVRAVAPSGLPLSVVADDEQAELDHFEQSDIYLHRIVNGLRRAGFDADLALYVAAPDSGITRAAELTAADLIVMTTHLRWKINPMGGRSVTLGVLARSHVPILAWRARAWADSGDVLEFDTEHHSLAHAGGAIVVPLDGSRFAELALPTAEALARAFDQRLLLVAALGDGAPAEQPPASQRARWNESSPKQRLEELREELEQRGVRSGVRIEHGTPCGVIDRVVREEGASLVVLASHGRASALGTFLGSVGASVLEQVEAPVLVVHPAAEPVIREHAPTTTLPLDG
jgi:nucleotide-binding universal stress UspA family protein